LESILGVKGRHGFSVIGVNRNEATTRSISGQEKFLDHVHQGASKLLGLILFSNAQTADFHSGERGIPLGMRDILFDIYPKLSFFPFSLIPRYQYRIIQKTDQGHREKQSFVACRNRLEKIGLGQ